jgi:hypothetical protein
MADHQRCHSSLVSYRNVCWIALVLIQPL